MGLADRWRMQAGAGLTARRTSSTSKTTLRQQQLAGQRSNGGGSCSQPCQQGKAATTVQTFMDADSGGSISGDMTETEAAHRIRHADAEVQKKCPRCRQHESNAE